MNAAAIVVGGGRGVRFGGDEPKALSLLAGKPLFLHVIERLADVQAIVETVVVAPADALGRFRSAARAHRDRIRFVAGGERRQDSVRAGVRALGGEIEWVLVHDAARPLVARDVVSRTLEAAFRANAAIAAVPLRDSLKEVDGAGAIVRTPSRERLWLAQTPQVFRRELLERAHARAEADGFDASDDAALVERLGLTVTVALGDPRNLKITFPEDLALAEALLGAESLRR